MPTLQQNRLLLGGRRTSINYLLRLIFPTLDAAPLDDPYVEGAYSLDTVQDDGNLSIVAAPTGLAFPGNVLRLPAPGAAGYNKTGIIENVGQTRTPGLVVLMHIYRQSFSGNWGFFGWRSAASFAASITDGGNEGVMLVITGALTVVNNGSTLTTGITMAAYSVPVAFAIAANATGYDYYICGGEWNEWTLLFRGLSDSTATLYEAVGTNSATYDVGLVETFVANGLNAGDLAQASPVNATSYSGFADGFHTLTLTAPGTISAEAGLIWSYTDANNYFRAYFNTSGAFLVEKIIGGSRTELLAAVAGVIATSATRTIAVRKEADVMRVYTVNGTAWTLRATITDDDLMLATAVRANIGSGWTAANLTSKPLSSSAYNALTKPPVLASSSTVLTLDGRNYIAFPDMALLPNGDLFCIYKRGTGHVGDDTATIEYRIKKVGAALWNAPVTLQAAATRTSPQSWNGCYCTVIGTRLIVFVMEYESEAEMSTWMRYSDDNAETFSAKAQITSTYLAAASNYQHGNVVELGDGTLLTTLWGRRSGNSNAEIVIMESSDDGETWTERSHLTNANLLNRHASEADIILNSAGDLLLVVRQASNTLFFTSIDDGENWALSSDWVFSAGNPRLYKHIDNQIYLFTRDITVVNGQLVRYNVSNDGTSRTNRTVLDTYDGSGGNDGGYGGIAWDGSTLHGVYYRKNVYQGNTYIAERPNMLA